MNSDQNPEINNFFYPSSICIAGASSKEKSIGYEILNSIRSYGYKGKIYPVNPKTLEILGYRCYKSIDEVKETIDLAIIVVPKLYVELSIDSLLEKGVKSLILITAGFRETGLEGEELENRIVEKIKESKARLVGPNCMGVINTLENIKLNATFVAEKPEIGKTAFLSQSGALGAAVLNSLRETDIKFAHFISVGNKADITENDLLAFWLSDPNIEVMTFYLESFVNGEEFIKPFMREKVEKPVIVLKAAKTSSGKRAAESHTGAISSFDSVVDSLMKQVGIIRAETLNDLFNTSKAFEHFQLPAGKNVAVVTNAGGPAILTVDKMDECGLSLAELDSETKDKLSLLVHPAGSIQNPVDLLPGASAEVYKSVIETVLNDKNVDAVISIFVEPVMVSPFEVIEAINGIEHFKPVLQVCMPLPEFWNDYRKKSKTKKPLFRNPEDPAVALSNMLQFVKSSKKMRRHFPTYVEQLNRSSIKEITSKNNFLSQEEIQKIADSYSLPLIEERVISPGSIKIFEGLPYPLVIKGLNKDITHKSDLNLVKINIRSRSELIEKAEEIKSSLHQNDLNCDGFLIQPFIPAKHELLIGGFRDSSFGPIIVFGTGGKYVEVLNDRSIKSAYLSDDDIDDMIQETSIGKIIKGVRGESPYDIKLLKQIIKNAALMILENRNILEFDINPLIISSEGNFKIVDIRIKIK